MAKLLDKAALYALDNVALIYQARAAGLTIRPEDLLVNYAEMDFEITGREDKMVEDATKRIRDHLSDWLDGIRSADDVKEDGLELADLLQESTLAMIRSVWGYGSETAERELTSMGLAQNWEAFAAGDPADEVDENDAFTWYEEYSRKLATSGNTALFIKMQPLILEAIEAGVVGTKLRQMLLDDFTRYGSVRADIIARTEGTKAYNWGRRYRFDSSPALAGYRYSAILDGRTTQICRGLHDRSWPVGSPDLDGYTPPNHYRCRSVLVPISKYKDWNFQGPDAGWMSSLPKGERDNLLKFMDASWYPKQSTVRAMDLPDPNAPKPKKKPAAKNPAAKKPRAKKASAPPGPDPIELAAKEIGAVSTARAIKNVETFLDTNKSAFAAQPNHPAAVNARDALQELQRIQAAGGVASAEVKSGAWTWKIKEYDYLDEAAVYYWKHPKTTKDAADRILDDMRKIGRDPLYAGVKLEMVPDMGSTLASYNAGDDILEMTRQALTAKSGGVATLHHEIGHRVHNIRDIYGDRTKDFASMLRKHGINLSDGQWSDWAQTIEPYWESARTPRGSKILPDDMADRWNYPINAPYYYNNGNKGNFQKEMFAEGSSVYLENNPAEVAKVRRTYPGLLEFLEKEVYKRGYIK